MGFIEAVASLAASAHLINKHITPWLDKMENIMTPEEAREILKKAKANDALLEACPGHEFEQREGLKFTEYKCRRCGGEANGHSVLWYRRGLAHGGKKC